MKGGAIKLPRWIQLVTAILLSAHVLQLLLQVADSTLAHEGSSAYPGNYWQAGCQPVAPYTAGTALDGCIEKGDGGALRFSL